MAGADRRGEKVAAAGHDRQALGYAGFHRKIRGHTAGNRGGRPKFGHFAGIESVHSVNLFRPGPLSQIFIARVHQPGHIGHVVGRHIIAGRQKNCVVLRVQKFVDRRIQIRLVFFHPGQLADRVLAGFSGHAAGDSHELEQLGNRVALDLDPTPEHVLLGEAGRALIHPGEHVHQRIPAAVHRNGVLHLAGEDETGKFFDQIGMRCQNRPTGLIDGVRYFLGRLFDARFVRITQTARRLAGIDVPVRAYQHRFRLRGADVHRKDQILFVHAGSSLCWEDG